LIHRLPSVADVRGSRAFGSGSRRLALLAAAVAIATGGAVAGVLLTRSGRPAAGGYGQIPSWLPQPKTPVGRIVSASPAHPWLAIEGDSVSVRFARGRVLATAVGPQVPEEGRFPVPATSPCTFVVTFARTSGTVPLRSSSFTILDEDGRLHRPRVTVLGGGALPARLPAGKTISVKVSSVLPTGSGDLRWAPGGRKPVVSWDFDVEID